MKYLFYSKYTYVSSMSPEAVAGRLEPYSECTIARWRESRSVAKAKQPPFKYVFDHALPQPRQQAGYYKIGLLAFANVRPLADANGTAVRVSIRHGVFGQFAVYGFMPLIVGTLLYFLISRPDSMPIGNVLLLGLSILAYLALVYEYAKQRRHYQDWFEGLFGESWPLELVDSL